MKKQKAPVSKKKCSIIFVLLLLMIGVGAGSYYYFHESKPKAVVANKSELRKKKTETGVYYSPSVEQRRTADSTFRPVHYSTSVKSVSVISGKVAITFFNSKDITLPQCPPTLTSQIYLQANVPIVFTLTAIPKGRFSYYDSDLVQREVDNTSFSIPSSFTCYYLTNYSTAKNINSTISEQYGIPVGSSDGSVAPGNCANLFDNGISDNYTCLIADRTEATAYINFLLSKIMPNPTNTTICYNDTAVQQIAHMDRVAWPGDFFFNTNQTNSGVGGVTVAPGNPIATIKSSSGKSLPIKNCNDSNPTKIALAPGSTVSYTFNYSLPFDGYGTGANGDWTAPGVLIGRSEQGLSTQSEAFGVKAGKVNSWQVGIDSEGTNHIDASALNSLRYNEWDNNNPYRCCFNPSAVICLYANTAIVSVYTPNYRVEVSCPASYTQPVTGNIGAGSLTAN